MQVVGPAAVMVADETDTLIPDGAVAIHDDRIMAVGRFSTLSARFSFAQVISPGGNVLIPGLVDGHAHFMAELQGLLAQAHRSGGSSSVMSHRSVYIAAMYGAVQAIRSGVTTVYNLMLAPLAVEGVMDQMAWAMSEAGLRSCISYEVGDWLGEEAVREAVLENARCAAGLTGVDRLRTKIGLGVDGDTSPATLIQVARAADQAGCGVHAHLRPQAEGSAIPMLERFGLLRPDTLLGNVGMADLEHAALLLERQVTLALGPQGIPGVGWGPLAAYRRNGGRVVLGSDGGALWDGQTPEATEALLRGNPELATRTFGRTVGRLEVGALADLVAVKTDVQPTSIQQVVAQVLQGDRVETVIAGGQVVLRNRQVVSVDEERVVAVYNRLISGEAGWGPFGLAVGMLE